MSWKFCGVKCESHWRLHDRKRERLNGDAGEGSMAHVRVQLNLGQLVRVRTIRRRGLCHVAEAEVSAVVRKRAGSTYAGIS